MKTTPNKYLAHLPKSLPASLLAASLLLTLVLSSVPAQPKLHDGKMQHSFNAEGVSGTYIKARRVYSFDSTFLSKRAFRGRILRPDHTLLAECIREGDIMTVKFPTGNLIIDLVNKTLLPDSDGNALSSFSVTEDAALIRDLLFNLSLHRTDKNQKLLVGFAVIALLLGEGPDEGTMAGPLPKMKGSAPAFAQKVSYLKCTTNNSANFGECHGCCGPGCWGCSGCYTAACLAHDNCVNDNGYFTTACDALAVIAAASMVGCVVN
jgi:hypothetical protein